MVKRAVFLDRDGVINANILRDGRPVAPTTLEQFRLLPGVEEAARRLSNAGYDIIVITNQPDVATGRTSRETVTAMHDAIRARMPVDEIKVCFHTDADNCGCRKPKPGMILDAAKERGIDLRRSWVVGDRWRDIEAGRIAGCLTAFVDYGYEQEGPNSPDVVVASLAEAAERILALDEVPTEPITLSRRRDNAMNATSVNSLRIKIFADGADLKSMKEAATNPLVKGFTTNPTLMRQAGVTDYKAFAREVLAAIPDRPVSFEVFADDFATMEAQGREIASWGDNVYVKVPVTNTKGEFAGPLLATLSRAGVKLNVTAIMTLNQVRKVGEALAVETPAVVSVFAGRIADTGRDPVPLMRDCVALLKNRPKAELLWASPRELLNIFQADEIGCHIITVTGDVIKKLALVGKDLDAYSRETVAMFYRDATSAGFDIPVTQKKAAS
jgi:transaldolase